MIQYKTVLNKAEAEQVIERSRFIAHVRPVESREEADSFFSEIRSQHKTASHNVPALVIGDRLQMQWASDDGEPQGTSGAPMVQMLVNEGITNTAIVVTRYFGGIKLGTGGLVRAYTSSAKLGIQKAGLCQVKEVAAMQFKIDYSFLSKAQNLSQGGEFSIDNILYEDMVTLKVLAELENAERIKELFNNLTAGTAGLILENTEFVKIAL